VVDHNDPKASLNQGYNYLTVYVGSAEKEDTVYIKAISVSSVALYQYIQCSWM
jgi:hypothetical protein